MRLKSFSELIKVTGWVKDKELFCARLKSKGYNEEALNLLFKIRYLLLETKFTSDRFKDVFNNSYSYKEVSLKYGVAVPNLRAHVVSTMAKLKFLDFDPVELAKKDSLNDLERIKIKEAEDMIGDLITKYYCNQIVKDLFSFDIPEVVLDISEDLFGDIKISDDEFIDLIDRLVPLTKKFIKDKLSGISNRHLSYVIYLITSNESNLSEDEKERKKKLIGELL